MQFTPYALPAMLAFVAKVAIFFYARYSKVQNLQTQLYLLFLFCMAVQNLLEIRFFMINAAAMEHAPHVSGTLYFGVSILAIGLLLHLAIVMATSWRRDQENLSRAGLALVYTPVLVLEVMLWSGPSLVAGFERMGYTYTRIPGPLFFLWEIYSVGYLCAAAALFVYGVRTQSTNFRRLQNRLLLVGLSPIVAVVVAVVGLQHFGVRSFNATATLPVAITFFLAVTAYATHQYRLFDIQFFIPWSKVRKRKTGFYKRIQSLVAEISEMSSVQKIIQAISDALHCPVALIGGPTPSLAIAGKAFRIARFPLDELRKIDHIVVANEIAEAMPTTYSLMRRHNVAAIVPFHPHSQIAANWMLLGNEFSEQVYSPLDFRTVETLFARLADHFLDNQVLLRAQLREAQCEMDALRTRLANAWEQIDVLRGKLDKKELENGATPRLEVEALQRDLTIIQADTLDHASEKRSLDQHVAEFEARLIAKTLEHADGDMGVAAGLLGLPTETLQQKLEQIAKRGTNPEEPQVFFV